MKTQEFVRILRRHSIDPKIIYDAGAFDCQQSLELSQAFPKATVCAFEPVPENYQVCVRRTLTSRVNPFMLALGDKSGPVTFHKSTGHNKECGSVLPPNGAYWEPMPTEEIEVEMRRIDDLVLEPPSVLWMDVQGNELAVLRGMGDRLNNLKALWTEVTYKAYYQGQILARDFDVAMAAFGFEKVCESVAMPGWFGDACFVKCGLL